MTCTKKLCWFAKSFPFFLYFKSCLVQEVLNNSYEYDDKVLNSCQAKLCSSAPLSSLDGVGVWIIFPQNNLPDFVADFAAVRYQIWLLLSPLLVKSEHLSVKTWQFNTRCELYHVDSCTVNQALSDVFKKQIWLLL